MYRIMFVCHGNICRSPMAEFVFADLAEKAGRRWEFSVASSGVSSEEIWGDIGNPVYPPVKALLAEKGISCGGKRAVQLKASDGEKYDLFALYGRRQSARGQTHSRRKKRGKMQKTALLCGERRGRIRPLVYAGLCRGLRGYPPRLQGDFGQRKVTAARFSALGKRSSGLLP